jgi:hypothetical protein
VPGDAQRRTARALHRKARVRALPVIVVAGVLASVASAGSSSSAPSMLPASSPPVETAGDDPAVAEMLRGPKGREARWSEPPHLIIITSELEFTAGTRRDYLATAAAIPRAELVEMAGHMTAALPALTSRGFARFASVRFEDAVPDGTVRVVRSHHIVVARYRGLKSALQAVGYGGRTLWADGTITSGTIMLDSEYDRSSALRRLLRVHELGHALGYNHVAGRASIMNPTLGSDITAFDRRAAAIAFRR